MRVYLSTLLISFLLLGISSSAQSPATFMNDGFGRPLYWGSSYIPDGSPFFYDDYKWAELTTTSGVVYKDIRIKFNLLNNELQYILDDGKEMVTVAAMKSVRFVNVATENGALVNISLVSTTGVLNAEGAIIYQVLDSGKASLLKRITLTYRDEKRYGEAAITRHFDRAETDYIQLENTAPQKLEKNKSFITDFLKGKKTELETFIEKNKLKCKSTKDFQLIVQHYNSFY